MTRSVVELLAHTRPNNVLTLALVQVSARAVFSPVVIVLRRGMLGTAKLDDFRGHDFTDHFADMPALEIAKGWPVSDAETGPRDCKRLTSFMMVSPSVAADENWKDCEEQILPFGRPSFNFNN